MGQTNPDEHMLLDDNKYIADVLYEVKNSKQKDLQQSRLLFKKRMFRETDETITEAQFVNLSYVQVACLLTGRPVGCSSTWRRVSGTNDSRLGCFSIHSLEHVSGTYHSGIIGLFVLQADESLHPMMLLDP